MPAEQNRTSPDFKPKITRVTLWVIAAFLTFFDHTLPGRWVRELRHLFNMTERLWRNEGRLRMQLASTLVSLRKLGRNLFALGAFAVAIGGTAYAQNLDQGKSAERLFGDGCATCHRSARGLAKGRFSLTLFLFLQKHYATSSGSAWALTSYLESVDSRQRGQLRAATAKPSSPAGHTSRASIRPPELVPAH